ncbi:MAG TPA: hypothetical protein ENK48_01730 [Gammaproteobacteria bacterium]|nr:hypothetical protein [Gammaproteobacteria bacterium]
MLLAAVWLQGCASYGDWVEQMEHRLADGDYPAALAVLEQEGRAGRDALLYLLNRGLLLRMAGDLRGSNAAFEAAKTRMDYLDTLSLSEQAGALAVNELARSYTAEDYERMLVYVFEALNYLELGEAQEARVELMQLDEWMTRRGEEAGAFGRYFSGLVFQALGEWDQALVAYRKAYRAYQDYPPGAGVTMPATLEDALLTTSARLGLRDEAARYRADFGHGARETDEAGAEVVFILCSGLAPVKHESRIDAVTKEGILVTVALPYYEDRRPHVEGAVLTGDGRHARAEMVEDINALAMDALARARPVMLARALARAALKAVAVEKTDEKDEGLGFLANVVSVMSERADTRSWSLLPNRIYLLRLPLPAGSHELRLRLQDGAGRLVASRDYALTLKAGEMRFLGLHWVDDEDVTGRTRH